VKADQIQIAPFQVGCRQECIDGFRMSLRDQPVGIGQNAWPGQAIRQRRGLTQCIAEHCLIAIAIREGARWTEALDVLAVSP
jgi:hypothetical protein